MEDGNCFSALINIFNNLYSKLIKKSKNWRNLVILEGNGAVRLGTAGERRRMPPGWRILLPAVRVTKINFGLPP